MNLIYEIKQTYIWLLINLQHIQLCNHAIMSFSEWKGITLKEKKYIITTGAWLCYQKPAGES